MNRYPVILFFISLFSLGFSQDLPLNTKIIRVASSTSYPLKASDLSLPPANSEFLINNTDLVDRILNKFTYWDEMFTSTFETSLVIFPKIVGMNEMDTVLVVESPLDRYTFTKQGGEWIIKSFDIRGTNMTLSQIGIGQPSKYVYKLLHKKLKQDVSNSRVWVTSKAGKYFLFTFENDKLISMQF